MEKNRILVVGSTNVDMIARVKHLPVPGETIGDAVYSMAYGGKGANQAIAAAHSGGNVMFITNLGDDLYGNKLIPYFKENAIDIQYISKDCVQPTGTALIFVAESGENCIAVAPGANGNLKGEKIQNIYHAINQSEAIILQMEIPHETIQTLIEYANQSGVKVILNPAPAAVIEPYILRKVDVLILNETEAEMISGHRFSDEDPFVIARRLRDMGPEIVILTMGAKGAVVVSETENEWISSYKINAVDTTGAGDTFCGAFAVNWIETADLITSVRYATAAAALSVMYMGAQPSIPKRPEIELFIKNQEIEPRVCKES